MRRPRCSTSLRRHTRNLHTTPSHASGAPFEADSMRASALHASSTHLWRAPARHFKYNTRCFVCPPRPCQVTTGTTHRKVQQHMPPHSRTLPITHPQIDPRRRRPRRRTCNPTTHESKPKLTAATCLHRLALHRPRGLQNAHWRGGMPVEESYRTTPPPQVSGGR